MSKWQPSIKVQCKLCDDIIWSRYEGEFRTCKCGAISVDQTPYYTRYIGNSHNMNILGDDESDNNTN